MVCDDDKAFMYRLSEIIEKQSKQNSVLTKITGISNPADLSDQSLAEHDIVFLDIDMGQYNGMKIARRIRELQLDTVLIFVTNYVEYSLEGYEVNAFRYLLKQEVNSKFSEYFKEALAVTKRKEGMMSFSIGGEPYQIKYSKILYLESNQRMLVLHTVQPERNIDRFYGTLEDFEGELKNVGFLRIHKSFLVNMNQISKLNYDKAVLKNGEVLPVSQRRFSELKMRFLQWRAEQ